MIAAEVTQGDVSRTIKIKRAVILAAGGAPHDMVQRKTQMPHVANFEHYSMSPEANTGDTLSAAQNIGAQKGKDNLNPAFWTPVSRLKIQKGGTVAFPHLFLDRAKPGVIAVTDKGERFVNESASYHDFVSGMLEAIQVDAKRFYLICDHRFIRRYGLGAVRPFPGRITPFIQNGYLTRAATPEALAEAIDIPVANFKDTLLRYNADAKLGKDIAFGKGSTAYNRYPGDPEQEPNPCLRAITDGPFYALRIHSGDIGTATEILTDYTVTLARLKFGN